MPKRMLTIGAGVLGVVALVGLAVAAANSVSTQPRPAYISRHIPGDQGSAAPSTATTIEDQGADQPAVQDLGDQPATPELGDDHGTDQPATQGQGRDGGADPSTATTLDDHGGTSGHGSVSGSGSSTTDTITTSTTGVDDHGGHGDERDGQGGKG